MLTDLDAEGPARQGETTAFGAERQRHPAGHRLSGTGHDRDFPSGRPANISSPLPRRIPSRSYRTVMDAMEELQAKQACTELMAGTHWR